MKHYVCSIQTCTTGKVTFSDLQNVNNKEVPTVLRMYIRRASRVGSMQLPKMSI